MALTKETIISKIEVLEDGQIQVRVSTRVLEGGVQLSETYHRKVLTPGDLLVGEDARVATVAGAVWTPAVVSAYKAGKAARQLTQS